ncbi:type II secretion system F family protein [Streptomyces roseirectus]|uniref:Type II secretion system F family protein n=1 Tax=Streptomyces roseirectus TaxID=2768066 RepID=A0A7H0IQB2_9ACTN|nr:type II secretion system F family protein [Streptomyces roseirectus]QNP74978.1 type II secretion system F family protein [Streptomyces roseirectus]
MIALAVLGAGIGLGVWALVRWLFPPRPPLAELTARLNTGPALPSVLPVDAGGWAARLGAPFVGFLRAAGLPGRTAVQDLAVTERSHQVHLAEKAALTLVGLLLPGIVATLLALAGRPLSWPLPLATSLIAAAGGFLLPDASAHAEAERRRAAFRHALGAYLDLTHVLLAGGAGIEGALTDAARTGHGRSFRHLQHALTTARLTRTTPWAALARLGEELHIGELTELAASLSLAGTEGAKVRASLAAKAAAMRRRGGAEAEGKANAATERMAVPAALMAFGFIAFVFYPALIQITNTL